MSRFNLLVDGRVFAHGVTLDQVEDQMVAQKLSPEIARQMVESLAKSDEPLMSGVRFARRVYIARTCNESEKN